MSTGGQRASDLLSFLRSWASAPLRVGAVAPSGRGLAGLITREIEPTCAPVLELGPGTGVFTRALLAAGVREDDLTLVEYDEAFAGILAARYPKARLVRMDAADLSRMQLFHGRPVGAVVSGLPLLSMPLPKVMRIVSGLSGCLRADGAIYQFTYGLRCPVPDLVLDRFGLRAMRIGRVWWNMPPAAVYRIERTSAMDLIDVGGRLARKAA
ncbi:class I SAM-dependent methyltransferase [Aureimonas mangrovi]|uniref:class I SAM-dependent methyltransferase n=1 Tax=Aureimonas mangrovi TaxID=2758041 RepID=UPI00163D4FA9|nr:rRNA adenine N-6-methyltransferase family protein [Aureimonas mangrovi]